MTFPEITQAERARWQRRAATELTAILQACPDLPVIAWIVGSAGSTLTGQVTGANSAKEVRAVFDSWRTALILGEHSEHSANGGVSYLRAVADRNRVRVAVTATVFDDEDSEPNL